MPLCQVVRPMLFDFFNSIFLNFFTSIIYVSKFFLPHVIEDISESELYSVTLKYGLLSFRLEITHAFWIFLYAFAAYNLKYMFTGLRLKFFL